jgi:hypothetical protein
MLGTFSSGRPSAAMLSAIKRLLAWKLDLTHVDPTGKTILRSAGGANVYYPAGGKLYARTIFGHRSTSFTDCPGSPTIALLPSIRAAVSRIGRPKIYQGRVSAGRVQPERGGSVVVAARFSSKVHWRVTVTGSNPGPRAQLCRRGHPGPGPLERPDAGGGGGHGHGRPARRGQAAAGGATARPAVSRVFVDRAAPPAGTSTGGFSKASGGQQRQRRAAVQVGPGIRHLPVRPLRRRPGGGGLGRRRHPDRRGRAAEQGRRHQPLLPPQLRRLGPELHLRPLRRPAPGRRLGRQRHLDTRGCCAAGAGGSSRTPSAAARPRSAWPSRPRGPRWSATGTTGPDRRPRPVRELRRPG